MLELKQYLIKYNHLVGLYDNLQFRFCFTLWKNDSLNTISIFCEKILDLFHKTLESVNITANFQFVFLIETNLAFHTVFACECEHEYRYDRPKFKEFLNNLFSDNFENVQFTTSFYFFIENFIFNQNQIIRSIFFGWAVLPEYSFFLYNLKKFLETSKISVRLISLTSIIGVSYYNSWRFIENENPNNTHFFNLFSNYCLFPCDVFVKGITEFMDSVCLEIYATTVFVCDLSHSFRYSYWNFSGLLGWANTSIRSHVLVQKVWDFFFVINLNLDFFANDEIVSFFYDLIAKRFFSVPGLQFGFFYWSLDNKFYGWLGVCGSFCPTTWSNNFLKEFFFIHTIKDVSLETFINIYCSSSIKNIPINRFYVGIYNSENWILYWELYNRIKHSLFFQKMFVLNSKPVDKSKPLEYENSLSEDLAMGIEHKYIKFYLERLQSQEKEEGELLTPWLIAPPERMQFV